MPLEEGLRLGRELVEHLDRRRSVRAFSPDPVPAEAIELAVRAANTAPSGAHHQPWTFVAVSDPDLGHRIRLAAEAEERRFYRERNVPEWHRPMPVLTRRRVGCLAGPVQTAPADAVTTFSLRSPKVGRDGG